MSGRVRAVPFARDLVRWESERRLTLAASGASFWLCLAAFPAAVAAVNILGLLVPQEEVARTVSDLALIGSTAVGRVLEEQLAAVAAPSPGTALVDVALVLLALWGVSRAMRYLIDAIRAAHGLPKRGVALHYGISLAAGVLAVLGLGLIAYVAKVLAGGAVALLDVLGLLLAGGLVLVLYATALGREFTLRTAMPGALVATGGILLVSFGTRLYLRVAGDMSAIYGTLGGLVLAMFATWFIVYAILIGGSVNAQLIGRAD